MPSSREFDPLGSMCVESKATAGPVVPSSSRGGEAPSSDAALQHEAGGITRCNPQKLLTAGLSLKVHPAALAGVGFMNARWNGYCKSFVELISTAKDPRCVFVAAAAQRGRAVRVRMKVHAIGAARHEVCAALKMGRPWREIYASKLYAQRRARNLRTDFCASAMVAARCPPCALRSWARSAEHRGLPAAPARSTVIDAITGEQQGPARATPRRRAV